MTSAGDTDRRDARAPLRDGMQRFGVESRPGHSAGSDALAISSRIGIWRVRNVFGDAVFRWLAKPILREINARRLRHGLPRLAGRCLEEREPGANRATARVFDYPPRAATGLFLLYRTVARRRKGRHCRVSVAEVGWTPAHLCVNGHPPEPAEINLRDHSSGTALISMLGF